MKKLFATMLFVCVCAIGSAAAPEASQKADIDALTRQAQELGDAMVAGDVDKIREIFAEDWVSVSSKGTVVTRDSVLDNFKSGKDKLASFTIDHIDVLVLGNIAAVHGAVTEKRTFGGKDTSGKLLWTDICEKRDGKWVIIRSAGAKATGGV